VAALCCQNLESSMRFLTSCSLLLLLAAGATTSISAMDQDMPGMASGPMNAMCPMCDKPVGAKPSTVKVTVGEGADAKTCMMGFDSMDCAKAFSKDPEPVLKKAFGKDAPGFKTGNK
jgi:hypothetical protein